MFGCRKRSDPPPLVDGAMRAAAGSEASDENRYYMCECRYTRNFFVRSAGANGDHFEYFGNDLDFRRHYADILEASGGATAEEVLREIKLQVAERCRQPDEALSRARDIAERYQRLEADVYTLDAENFLTTAFRQLVAALKSCEPRPSAILACVEDLKERGILEELKPDLWTFSVFTQRFCDLFESEIAHFEASDYPKARPNTMNRYGVILRELGFSERFGIFDQLVSDYIDPVAGKLLPLHTEGLDSHRSFTVKYDAVDGGDRELALHYDNAEITLNVNAGGSWEGGQVTFFGDVDDPVDKTGFLVTLRRGYGVLHPGRMLHRAEPVTSGHRHNLVIWCRSSRVRNEHCPMCFRPPSVIPTNVFMHEGFTVPPCVMSLQAPKL